MAENIEGPSDGVSEIPTPPRTGAVTGSCTLRGEQVDVDVEDLGVRPAQESVPLLVGGHGRRMVELAARCADVFQYTGLTHERGSGSPTAGRFSMDHLRDRKSWIDAVVADERVGDRPLQLSTLVQVTHLGDDAADARRTAGERIGLGPAEIDATPFVLIGTVGEIVEKLQRLREELAVHHVVIRDAPGFAPVMDALAGS